MANGIKALRKIQLGRMADSDSDTAVPATTIWRGTGTIEDARNTYFIQEDVGIITGTDRSNTSSYLGKLTLDPIEASPEQLPHLFEMGIKTVSPTSDSGGDGFIYQYDIPTTSTSPFKPYTVEGGDNAGAEVMPYCFAESFKLSANEKEAWKMGASLLGKNVTPQSFTGGVLLPTVTNFNFGTSYLYIDNDSDVFGTTLVSQTLLQAQLDYKTGLVFKYTADGSLSPSFVQCTMPEATLKLTFEHNTSAIAEKAFWRSETARLLRLKTLGNAFTTGGDYSNRTFISDLAGKYLKFEKLGERNGNDVVECTFQMKYNAAQAVAGKFIVVNSLSSLP
jgi:hypothetical protein